MSIIIDRNENAELNQKIISKSKHVCEWGFMMGRPVCMGPKEVHEHWWSGMDDWPDGGGYIDHTPWLVFKNHIKEKHGLDIKVFSD